MSLMLSISLALYTYIEISIFNISSSVRVRSGGVMWYHVVHNGCKILETNSIGLEHSGEIP